MNEWIVLIIVIVFGIIVSNLLLLKQSAKMKLPKPTRDNNKNWDEDED